MKRPCRLAVLALAAVPIVATADVTLDYQTTGQDCRGDFERMQIKGAAMRIDSDMGGRAGSFVYDGVEKIAYALDHREHRFMQFEVDEDAIDFNADRTASLQNMMRNKTGVDPFARAQALCPGMMNGNQDAAQPGQSANCGQANPQGSAAADVAAGGGVRGAPGMNADQMQNMQRLMQEQMAKMTPEQRERMQRGMASAGYGTMLGAAATQPESDREAGGTTVAGVACMRRQHLRGDEIVREDCVTSLEGLELKAADVKRIARMAGVMARWRDSMMPAGVGTHRGGPSLERALVQRVCFAGGAESGRATLRIGSGPIADAEFTMPAGYAPMSIGLQGAAAKP